VQVDLPPPPPPHPKHRLRSTLGKAPGVQQTALNLWTVVRQLLPGVVPRPGTDGNVACQHTQPHAGRSLWGNKLELQLQELCGIEVGSAVQHQGFLGLRQLINVARAVMAYDILAA
jgi:hypothetical protein